MQHLIPEMKCATICSTRLYETKYYYLSYEVYFGDLSALFVNSPPADCSPEKKAYKVSLFRCDCLRSRI